MEDSEDKTQAMIDCTAPQPDPSFLPPASGTANILLMSIYTLLIQGCPATTAEQTRLLGPEPCLSLHLFPHQGLMRE
jgi:hypothetical protein